MSKASWCIAIVLAMSAASASAAEKWYWDLSLDEALKKAADEKKLVFIDFYADWCQPCKMMDGHTFRDPKVVAWLRQHTVGIKIDAEKNMSLALQYKVNSFPTFVLVKPDGTEFDRLLGYLTPEQILPEFAGIAEGKDGIARARDALEKGDASDPMLRINLANAYMAKGKHDEAVKEMLWCLDEGFRKHPEYNPYRRDIVMQLRMMSQWTPRVTDELAQRRTAAQTKVDVGKADENDVYNLAVLNEAFGEPQKTLEVYDALRSRKDIPPAMREALVKAVFPALLNAKRYKDLAADLDIMAEVDKQFANAGEIKKEDLQARYMLIANVTAYYQVLVGAGRTEEARRTARRLIAVSDDAETYNALAWSGYQTGNPTEDDLMFARKAEAMSNNANLAVTDTLARVLFARGMKKEAIEVAQRGLKIAITPQERAMMQDTVNAVKQ